MCLFLSFSALVFFKSNHTVTFFFVGTFSFKSSNTGTFCWQACFFRAMKQRPFLHWHNCFFKSNDTAIFSLLPCLFFQQQQHSNLASFPHANNTNLLFVEVCLGIINEPNNLFFIAFECQQHQKASLFGCVCYWIAFPLEHSIRQSASFFPTLQIIQEAAHWLFVISSYREVYPPLKFSRISHWD